MKYYKLDRDVKQYLKRMAADGIKTPADIYSVNDFVVGLKDLNLYSNALDIWFFRIEQNKGSGSIIYPFKKDNNKITLVNNPLWTSNGIYFNGTNQYGTMNNLDAGVSLREIAFGTCFLCHDNSTTRRTIFSSELYNTERGPMIVANSSPKAGGSAGALWSEFTLNGSISPNSVVGPGSAITRTFQSYITSFSPNNHTSCINGGGINTGTNISSFWNNNSTFYIGARNVNDSVLLGTISFLIWWNSSVSSLVLPLFHNLYKNTAGKGLGLP